MAIEQAVVSKPTPTFDPAQAEKIWGQTGIYGLAAYGKGGYPGYTEWMRGQIQAGVTASRTMPGSYFYNTQTNELYYGRWAPNKNFGEITEKQAGRLQRSGVPLRREIVSVGPSGVEYAPQPKEETPAPAPTPTPAPTTKITIPDTSMMQRILEQEARRRYIRKVNEGTNIEPFRGPELPYQVQKEERMGDLIVTLPESMIALSGKKSALMQPIDVVVGEKIETEREEAKIKEMKPVTDFQESLYKKIASPIPPSEITMKPITYPSWAFKELNPAQAYMARTQGQVFVAGAVSAAITLPLTILPSTSQMVGGAITNPSKLVSGYYESFMQNPLRFLGEIAGTAAVFGVGGKLIVKAVPSLKGVSIGTIFPEIKELSYDIGKVKTRLSSEIYSKITSGGTAEIDKLRRTAANKIFRRAPKQPQIPESVLFEPKTKIPTQVSLSVDKSLYLQGEKITWEVGEIKQRTAAGYTEPFMAKWPKGKSFMVEPMAKGPEQLKAIAFSAKTELIKEGMYRTTIQGLEGMKMSGRTLEISGLGGKAKTVIKGETLLTDYAGKRVSPPETYFYYDKASRTAYYNVVRNEQAIGKHIETTTYPKMPEKTTFKEIERITGTPNIETFSKGQTLEVYKKVISRVTIPEQKLHLETGFVIDVSGKGGIPLEMAKELVRKAKKYPLQKDLLANIEKDLVSENTLKKMAKFYDMSEPTPQIAIDLAAAESSAMALEKAMKAQKALSASRAARKALIEATPEQLVGSQPMRVRTIPSYYGEPPAFMGIEPINLATGGVTSAMMQRQKIGLSQVQKELLKQSKMLKTKDLLKTSELSKEMLKLKEEPRLAQAETLKFMTGQKEMLKTTEMLKTEEILKTKIPPPPPPPPPPKIIFSPTFEPFKPPKKIILPKPSIKNIFGGEKIRRKFRAKKKHPMPTWEKMVWG